MEQRLSVGGKRVTTGRLSSVVVDLFHEAFPGPEPVGKTESVSRPRYAAVKDDVRIPDFAYSSEIAWSAFCVVVSPIEVTLAMRFAIISSTALYEAERMMPASNCSR